MKLRIHNKHQSKYHYALSKEEARRVRVIGIAGLVSLVALITGFYYFTSQSILVAVLCAPFFITAVLYHLVNYWLMTLYPGFDTKAHRKRVAGFKRQAKQPRIAVFIPAAGEAISIVSQTVRGAAKIDYTDFDVFVLDDSKEGIYKEMAAELGVKYLRRREVGLHKKAGNMNAAMKRIKGYSHILVLDADFVPRKEILWELAPYATDEVGIVQSPQHFELSDEVYSRSKIEFGAGMIQRDFYRITQVARNRMGGAICVGTNALYNITALKRVGGFEGVGRADWGHSEDVHTGLKMLNTLNQKGDRYQIKYVPIQLATGICPSDHLSFYKQQNRWATGSMQLIFSRKTLFSRMLSIPQKITYFSNSVYYFYTMGLLFAPVQLLILLLSPRSYDWSYTLLFLPMLLVVHVLTPFLLRQKIEPVASSVVVISNAYTFVQALWLLIIRRPLGWEATGAKSAVKKRHPQFRAMKLFSSGAFIIVYLATLTVLVMNYEFGFNPSTFITLVFLASFIGHIIYLHHMLAADITLKRVHVSRHAYGYIALALLVATTVLTGYAQGKQYDIKHQAGAIIALVEDKRNKKNEPAPVAVAKPVEAKPTPPAPIVFAAGVNGNQSEIAVKIVASVRAVQTLDQATAGKLQDKLMHAMGYQNLIQPDDSYTFTQAEITELITGSAHVYPHEQAFWVHYATQVGIGV